MSYYPNSRKDKPNHYWCEKMNHRAHIKLIDCRGCDCECDVRDEIHDRRALDFARALAGGR